MTEYERREYIVAYDCDGESMWEVRTNERITRCRDCKYCEPIRSGRIDGLKCVANSESVSVEPDGFCAWAERKEVER